MADGDGNGIPEHGSENGLNNGNGNGLNNGNGITDDDTTMEHESEESASQRGGKKRKYDNWVPIPTRNRYDILAHSAQHDATTSNAAQRRNLNTGNSNVASVQQTTGEIRLRREQQSADAPKKTTKTRTPPITVIGKSRNEVIEMCRQAGAKEDDVVLKQTTTGINVYACKPNIFVALRDHMKAATQCFTHDLSDEKQIKIVLKNLFRMEIPDLRAELEANGIKPIDIKHIAPKRAKFDDQMHYLLFFEKGQTTLNDLKKCRSLCYLKVEWEYYVSRKFGPTQCHRCQMFGHGSRHCTLPVKCLYDGESHETHNCPNVQNGLMRPDFVPVCANCGGNHFANHPSCVKLQQFSQVQQAMNSKNSKRNISRTPTNRVPDISNFPPLPRPQHPSRMGQPTATPHSFPRWGSQSPPPMTPTGSSRRTELFNGPELVQIAQEVIQSLGRCTTPDDQYMTIVNLAVRFLYNGP